MEYCGLTLVQNGMCSMLEHMDENCMNLSCIIFFDGRMDTNLLKDAIHRVIVKNDGLRIRLTRNDNEVVQYLCDCEKKDIEVCDLGPVKGTPFLEDWLDSENEKPMKLFNCELFQFKILDLHKSSACFVKLNHVISDGWSFNLVRQELEEEYKILLNKTHTELAEKPSFFQYAQKQQEDSEVGKMWDSIGYWMKKLAPPFGSCDPKPGTVSTDCLLCASTEFILPFYLRERLEDFFKQQHITVLAFCMALMLLYLSKANSSNDVLTSTFFHNRVTPEEQQMIGCFPSLLPIRVRMNQDLCFMDLLKLVMNEWKSAIRNKSFNAGLMREEVIKLGFLKPEDAGSDREKARGDQEEVGREQENAGRDQNKGLSPDGRFFFINTIVSFDNYNADEELLFARKKEEIVHLLLRIRQVNKEKLVFQFIYRLDIMQKPEVEQIYEFFLSVIAAVLEDPHAKLSELCA